MKFLSKKLFAGFVMLASLAGAGKCAQAPAIDANPVSALFEAHTAVLTAENSEFAKYSKKFQDGFDAIKGRFTAQSLMRFFDRAICAEALKIYDKATTSTSRRFKSAKELEIAVISAIKAVDELLPKIKAVLAQDETLSNDLSNDKSEIYQALKSLFFDPSKGESSKFASWMYTSIYFSPFKEDLNGLLDIIRNWRMFRFATMTAKVDTKPAVKPAVVEQPAVVDSTPAVKPVSVEQPAVVQPAVVNTEANVSVTEPAHALGVLHKIWSPFKLAWNGVKGVYTSADNYYQYELDNYELGNVGDSTSASAESVVRVEKHFNFDEAINAFGTPDFNSTDALIKDVLLDFLADSKAFKAENYPARLNKVEIENNPVFEKFKVYVNLINQLPNATKEFKYNDSVIDATTPAGYYAYLMYQPESAIRSAGLLIVLPVCEAILNS